MIRNPAKLLKSFVEATPGIEPGYTVLQARGVDFSPIFTMSLGCLLGIFKRHTECKKYLILLVEGPRFKRGPI